MSLRTRQLGLRTALCGALWLGAAVGVAQAAPEADLVVSGIVPSATEPPKVLVVVRNVGTRAVTRAFVVELSLDGQSLGRQQVRTKLSSQDPVHVEFLRPAQLSAGLHSLVARVDVTDDVKETDEGNNASDLTIWSRGAADAPARRTEGRRGR